MIAVVWLFLGLMAVVAIVTVIAAMIVTAVFLIRKYIDFLYKEKNDGPSKD